MYNRYCVVMVERRRKTGCMRGNPSCNAEQQQHNNNHQLWPAMLTSSLSFVLLYRVSVTICFLAYFISRLRAITTTTPLFAAAAALPFFSSSPPKTKRKKRSKHKSKTPSPLYADKSFPVTAHVSFKQS